MPNPENVLTHNYRTEWLGCEVSAANKDLPQHLRFIPQPNSLYDKMKGTVLLTFKFNFKRFYALKTIFCHQNKMFILFIHK